MSSGPKFSRSASPSGSGKPRPSRTLPVGDAESIARDVRERLAKRKPVLVILEGAHVGERHRIDTACSVGREFGNDVVLRDDRASKRHARFEVRGNDVYLVDLGSTNGTLVNDSRQTEARVRHGDKIFIGSTVLRLEWHDAVEDGFHDALERMISIDELTGLLQKRRFDVEGATLIDGALRAGHSVGVLMMDLDGIKKINDTYGHAFGAYCIAESGALIGRIVRESGIATRWGGDEYSAVLPRHDRKEVNAIAERILRGVKEHLYEREGIRLHPGVSIGVSVGPDDGGNLEELQRQADEALYRAKRAGKGRVSE